MWHVCRPLPQSVSFVVNGRTESITEECYWCMGDAPDADVNPRDGCVQDRSGLHQYYDVIIQSFTIAGWHWDNPQCKSTGFKNCTSDWLVTHVTRPPDWPVGADEVPWRCQGSLLPGSVDPATSKRCEL